VMGGCCSVYTNATRWSMCRCTPRRAAPVGTDLGRESQWEWECMHLMLMRRGALITQCKHHTQRRLDRSTGRYCALGSEVLGRWSGGRKALALGCKSTAIICNQNGSSAFQNHPLPAWLFALCMRVWPDVLVLCITFVWQSRPGVCKWRHELRPSPWGGWVARHAVQGGARPTWQAGNKSPKYSISADVVFVR
jgi:hypothetical protein